MRHSQQSPVSRINISHALLTCLTPNIHCWKCTTLQHGVIHEPDRGAYFVSIKLSGRVMFTTRNSLSFMFSLTIKLWVASTSMKPLFWTIVSSLPNCCLSWSEMSWVHCHHTVLIYQFLSLQVNLSKWTQQQLSMCSCSQIPFYLICGPMKENTK